MEREQSLPYLAHLGWLVEGLLQKAVVEYNDITGLRPKFVIGRSKSAPLRQRHVLRIMRLLAAINAIGALGIIRPPSETKRAGVKPARPSRHFAFFAVLRGSSALSLKLTA
ncbi:MAG: hypothetical protein A3G75_13155 [Verrucomicrobia bacterium RIFCSPLOWO2_12_FULL_64_8]|nr:MAG: hypothetical protein A3G75_13155 [Verrucomicrobia bacterium RIFCSPLOWO2_12_FULL_64_8]